jgi:hypothetical protein
MYKKKTINKYVSKDRAFKTILILCVIFSTIICTSYLTIVDKITSPILRQVFGIFMATYPLFILYMLDHYMKFYKKYQSILRMKK